MNTELSEAYFGVYTSSKEILKNNQRHLYCNMLDLLTNTCKTTGITCNKISNDDQVQFWISSILPLMFDEDSSIQASAVSALRQGLIHLDIHALHSSTHWSELKNDITTKYVKNLNKLREDKNSNWHHIWCLLIQILDKEILKGASTINSFLSIVELGFRSSDNQTRADAFICWRLLIQIFSKYNELSSPKRIKLICIPLKSSQSKSSKAADVKLRVWWYLFSCLGNQMTNYFESVVEPFFVFTFGFSKKGQLSALQQYPSIRETALACLAALISTERNSFLERFLKENSMEKIVQPSPLVQLSIFQTYWKFIANALFEALNLFNSESILSDVEQQLLHLIIKFMALTIIRFDIPQYRIFVYEELTKFSNSQNKPIIPFFNTIAAEGNMMEYISENAENYRETLDKFLLLAHTFKAITPPSILKRTIDNIFRSPANDNSNSREIIKILNIIIQPNVEMDYDYFEIKMLIWLRMSHQLLIYLREHSLDHRLKEFSSTLNNWILWPLRVALSFTGQRSLNSMFDCFSWDIWRQLILSGQNSYLRTNFLLEVDSLINDVLSSTKDSNCLIELYDIYVIAIMKNSIEGDHHYMKTIFKNLKSVLSEGESSKVLEGCLNTFRNMITELQKSEFERIFDDLKIIISEVMKIVEKSCISKQFYEDWKRSIIEKTKNHPNKLFSNQIKEIFNGNEVFVIIPSVWSLDPEKLTERQKERFAEKNDIPALYNDMSQSQESSIKPWTPKKIVLVKEDQKEISIENSKSLYEDDNCSVENSSIQSGEGASPKKKDDTSIEKLNTEIHQSLERSKSKEYNFRRRSTMNEEGCSSEIENDKSSGSAINVRPKSRRSVTKGKQFEEMTFVSQASDETLNENIMDTTESTKHKSDREMILDTEPHEEHAMSHGQEIYLVSDNPSNDVNLEKPNNDQFQKQNDIIEEKYMSPKKLGPQKFSLGSPPDRKLTNNTSSPTLRQKPAAQLTGRGAQLINMIRNKKYDVQQSTFKMNYSTLQQPYPKEDKRTDICPIQSGLGEQCGTDNASTAFVQKDLLIFSKRLPSPTASPSASILKRKLRRDSIEDLSESPALKRKRVSFHDPPVSITKEYIKDCEETKVKPKRCLILDKQLQALTVNTPEAKHSLKRRSKLDSILEIEKYGVQQPISSPSIPSHKTLKSDESMTSIKWNDNQNNTSCEKNKLQSTSMDVSIACSNLPLMETSTALDIVIQQCSIETILEKYFSPNNTNSAKSSNILAKFISNQMTSNPKMKASVLETLSENHSKDFLDHAVQENLSSVVCDRLNLKSVIDYICSKSKINTNCRNILLRQIPEVLKNSRIEAEKITFLKSVLTTCPLSDANILEIITLLMDIRNKPDCKTAGCVSESAVDSSSNL